MIGYSCSKVRKRRWHFRRQSSIPGVQIVKSTELKGISDYKHTHLYSSYFAKALLHYMICLNILLHESYDTHDIFSMWGVSGFLLTLKVLNFWNFTQKWSGWIANSYRSLKPLWSGMGEVVPARTSPTLYPPSPPTELYLSCLKVSQCINCRD